ncbi:MAG: hypothetical protein E7390_07020 [Ruminococcaceae bacterium]|nr:hypothetical protein [Oscillospiraceae bacterium]
MKRIICTLLILRTLCMGASAEIIGAGYATDINAYIDHFLVPSYNIDGYTAVLVRDLENFGYTVNWDESTKTVNFYRDFAKPLTPLVPSYEMRAVGTKVFDVYRTDIRTFFRGTEIPSYNIGGKTAVRLRDLAMVGGVQFDETTRRAEIFCQDLEYFEDELTYIKTEFYGSMLLLSKADYAIQPVISMLESGVYDATVVAEYKAFYDEITDRFAKYKEYKEPYGFDASAQELWWAMVNMRYAGETALIMTDILKNGGNFASAMEDYKQYRVDSLEQRRVALLVLDEEMRTLTMFW